MAGTTAIRIRTWNREPIQFSLKQEGNSLYLQPLDRACEAVAVRALDESTSLRAASGCCWRKPQWLQVQVMVGDEVQTLKIKVNDVVSKWGVAESSVREKCSDSDFETLVPKKVEPSRSSFSIQPSTATGTMSSVEEPLLRSEYSDEDLQQLVPSGQANSSRSSFSSQPSVETDTMSPVEESDKKEVSIDLSFLETPSFVEFVRFLKEPQNKDQYLKVLQTLGNHWPNLQKKRDKELRSWQRKCKAENLPNLPISCKPFPLEYFPGDESIWLHLTLDNKKRFAINLSTGKFYRLKLIQENQKVIYHNNPEVRISEFQLETRKIYRLFTPYFSTSIS